MKAVVIEKPGVAVLKKIEKPEIPSGFVRVQVKTSAICATDLEILSGGIPANYPLVPGHEWSGIVEAVAADVSPTFIGKRVTGSNDVVCLKCDACRGGNWRYCKDFEEIGFKRNGAYAEYMCVPAYGLCELPDGLSFTHAVLAEPVGVALGTLEKVEAKIGDTLLIIGAGSIGLCILQVAAAMGMSKIVVAAQSEKRLTLANELGAYAVIATEKQDLFAEMAKYHPSGSDVVIDATGAEKCIQDSLKLAKKGGRIGLAGYGGGKEISIRIDDIHIGNLKVIGAGNNWNKLKQAVDMIAGGLVDAERFVSKLIRLDQFEEGFKLAETRPPGFVKAVFDFQL